MIHKGKIHKADSIRAELAVRSLASESPSKSERLLIEEWSIVSIDLS